MPTNGIATAADFRTLAEAEPFEEPQRVVLPKSGLAVMLRRPKPVAFTLLFGKLPKTLAARLTETPGSPAGTGEAPALEAAEVISLAKMWTELFQRMFVEPRLSINPGPEEIHPNWIPAEDQEFLLSWSLGAVEALVPFRAEPGPTAVGASGGDVPLPPESTPGPDGDDGGVPV